MSTHTQRVVERVIGLRVRTVLGEALSLLDADDPIARQLSETVAFVEAEVRRRSKASPGVPSVPLVNGRAHSSIKDSDRTVEEVS